ncbi:hypothetical protein CVIRNUC_000318 [Coccomyxa viridis]|uniref:Uncharacterized protein n=1 Tax=Coccomyxa viridis TaxID=1274662 RepID=A0AAV1HTW0_9CHLO|nr:hypothetical protein CVIRNUC_000318 [Coccomyxa viridis]
MPFGTRKQQATRQQQTAKKSEWKVRINVRTIVLEILIGMGIIDPCIHALIDIARHGELEKRAKCATAAELLFDGSRGLVIVDGANKIMLMYLPWAIPEERASKFGEDLGFLLDQVKSKGKAPVRDDMWYVGNTVPRNYGCSTAMRMAAERKHPDMKATADQVLRDIVFAIQLACPVALTGEEVKMTDMERALCAIVPRTCVTSAGLTRDYVSYEHIDQTDVCKGPTTSAVAWFSEGHGEMPAGFWFVLYGLRVKLAMGNGAVLLFNSATMAHGTEGPKSITSIPGQVPRMGLAVHCMESVYKLAQQDAALMSESHKAISYKLMFQAKLAKGWKLSKADTALFGALRVEWPTVHKRLSLFKTKKCNNKKPRPMRKE